MARDKETEEKAKQTSTSASTREVDPAAKEHWRNGNALFEESKFEEAIKEYGEALRVDSKYADAYFNRALTERVINDFAAAKKDLEIVMDLQPQSADAPLLIGDMAESNKDYIGARFWYEKSLANNPDYTEAKNRLERIDSLIHMETEVGTKGKGEKQMEMEKEEVIQEGQIKKLAFFKSNIKFDSVIGSQKLKQFFYDNVILAIKEPKLFRKYGKKLGVGLLMYGPPGVGKCVSANSKVLLADGRYETIYNMVKKKQTEVISLTKQHKLSIQKASGHWELEGKPLLRFTTQRGREIEVTPEHPFMVRSGWTNAESLREGDAIGVPRHTPIFGNNPLPEYEVKLLAYFIAEGNLTQGQARFTNKDQHIVEDFISSIFQFDPNLRITTPSEPITYNVTRSERKGDISRTSIQKFLDKYNLSYTNSHNKKLPLEVFTLPKHLLALFLNRLFSCDGYYSENNLKGKLYNPDGVYRRRIISYTSMSKELVHDLQHLLLRFGVLSNITKKKNGAYSVSIYRNRDIDIFINEIGFFGDKYWKLKKMRTVQLTKIKKKGGNAIVYEKILKIEKLPAPEFVYDLTVDNTHNFIANNFIVHNTYIVQAIAGEADANVLIARLNQIIDMYTGNTEKNLHAIFEQARKNTPAIIFFDELDALGMKRGGGGPEGGESSAIRLAVNQFLIEMNGVEQNPEGIFVIGATNQPWDIDPALKRSGRFGDAVYLKPPNYWDRKALIEFYSRNKPRAGLSYGRIARATMGYSPADIERIVDKAAMLPLLHEHEFKKERKLTMSDVLRVLKDKDFNGSSLDEWYVMTRKEVISKTETQIIDGKTQTIEKEGKLNAQEKVLYKAMIKDIKRNTNPLITRFKKIMRWWAINIF